MRAFGNLATLGVFGATAIASVALSGCWAHREAREEAFANRVAEKCVEATRPTQVIVVPATGAAVVQPAPASQ